MSEEISKMEHKNNNYSKTYDRKKRILMVLVTLSLLLVFVFVLVSLGTIFIFSRDTKSENDHVNIYEYRKYDSKLEQVSHGEVMTYSHLEGDEFDHFQSRDGEYNLISNFGSKEYSCSGVCYCGSDEERRNIPTILQTIEKVLVVAVGVVLANRMAFYLFEEKCETELSEYCGKEDINTKVQNCVASSPSYPSNLHENELRYKCSGQCKKDDFFREGKFTEKAYEFECERLQLNGVSIVDTSVEEEKSLREVENEFLTFTLSPFCTQSSPKLVGYKQEGKDSLSYMCTAGEVICSFY